MAEILPKYIFAVNCAACGRNIGGSTDRSHSAPHLFCRSCIRLIGHAYVAEFEDIFEDKSFTLIQTLIREAGNVIYKHEEILPYERWWEAADNISVDIPDLLSYNRDDGADNANEENNGTPK